MNYKLCILAAGKGTRNMYAKDTHKAILPIKGESVVSYMLHKFGWHEVVIAVGHNADLVKPILTKENSDKPLRFVHVVYQGEGTGPGYSLLQCQEYLQCPFIYMACDTIVTKTTLPEPNKNWIGACLTFDKGSYVTMAPERGLVKKVYPKGYPKATHLAHIGMVGVKDYKTFWKGLSKPKMIDGEYTDISGIKSLIPHNLKAVHFLWLDTGTTEGYEKAKQRFG